jgi:hypothetical protein
MSKKSLRERLDVIASRMFSESLVMFEEITYGGPMNEESSQDEGDDL